MNKNLWVLFITAFLIRFIALNQSLWLDEATTAMVVRQYSFTEIITRFSVKDFHPPLYYLFMKLWTGIFGYSEISLRFPSIIFSLSAGYLVYLIGNKILNNDSGIAAHPRMTKSNNALWAAAFFLFNPLIIYYSQEARMYMMVTMLLTASVFYLIAGCRVSTFKYLLIFSLFTSLSIMTFYGSVFLIIPILIYLFYKKSYKYFVVSCSVLSVTCLVLSPLLYQQFINAGQQLQSVANWKSVLGTVNLKNLLLIPIKFTIGRISFTPKWLYWLISSAVTIIIWKFVLAGGFKNKLIFLLLISSIGLAIVFSFFTPLLQYFRFLFLPRILPKPLRLPVP